MAAPKRRKAVKWEKLHDEVRKTEPHWYAVQTYSSYEKRVREDLLQRVVSYDLKDKILRVEIPTERHDVVKDGKSRQVERKLYPSYVLVEMVLDERTWYVVRYTQGVMGFVGGGENPLDTAPLSEEEAAKLIAVLEKDQGKPKVEIDLKVGDTVVVKSGDFKGWTGPIVEVIPERGKVKFTLNILGRETVTEADYRILEKI